MDLVLASCYQNSYLRSVKTVRRTFTLQSRLGTISNILLLFALIITSKVKNSFNVRTRDGADHALNFGFLEKCQALLSDNFDHKSKARVRAGALILRDKFIAGDCSTVL